ncbi:MAG: prepilin-type N-terminal cleavage/methylation domain-containing protein, partial [Betaproteobacteria bacterium]|nr:prepilin-type N-terminal cleavage/methylation domain-containing protein [Betaproteobacteria bacterium]
MRLRGEPSRSLRTTAAFTLIEIALCIAVVAIAMVAIIGVLP